MRSFFTFFLLNLEAKSIDFALSLPKCILSLLSTDNHIRYKNLHLKKKIFNFINAFMLTNKTFLIYIEKKDHI